MNYIPDFCSMCLVSNKNLVNILLQDKDGIVIEEKLKVFLLELVVFKPYIVKYVCESCLETINFIYKFRIKCVENITTLNEYLQKFETQGSSKNINDERIHEDEPENKNKREKENFIQDNIVKSMQNKDETEKSKTFGISVITEEVFIKTEFEENMEASEADPLENVTVTQEDGQSTQFNEETHNKVNKNIASINTNELTYKTGNTVLKKGIRDLKDKLLQSKKSNNAEYLSTSNIIPKSTDEEAYKCNVCHKSFKRRHHLIRHTLTHTGEKPYACDMCDKAFSQISHLIRHKHTHTGDKPYQCDVCEKKFNRSDQMATHKRIHSGEKRYKCNACEKSYNRTDQLSAHRRTHHRENPFNLVWTKEYNE